MPQRLYLGASLLACLLIVTRNAHAFEDEWHLGGGVGFATLAGSDYATGPAFGVHGAYGLSDMFDLRLELMASRHSYPAAERPFPPATLLVSAAVGPAYKVDVGDWIPYAALLVGYYRFLGDTPSELGLDAPADEAAGASVALGIDWGPRPNLGFGLQGRFHGIFDNLPSTLEQTAFFSLLLRGEWRFGR